MGKRIIHIILFTLAIIPVELIGQVFVQETGEISFMNKNNVYVRFTSTKDIEIGDTLRLNDESKLPCLVVSMKSSSSVVCDRINDCQLEKGMVVSFVTIKQIAKSKDELNESDDGVVLDTLEDQTIIVKEDTEEENTERIRSRLSVAGFSNISPFESRNRHRLMSRFSIRADHINNSRVSFEAYLNYRQNFLERTVPEDYQTKFLRIYSGALTYTIDSSSFVSIGRKINRKFSSVGATDGLQFEKGFGKLSFGVLAGFKPDITQFDLNTKLFQSGGFLNFEDSGSLGYVSSTLGIIDQRNAGATDRRFLYYQSSSTIARRLNLFVSAEMDIFSNIAGQSKTDFRLTNLFSSVRFRVNRKIDLTFSYDNRKRIIYFETFKTEIEEILEDDLARQGLRFRINLRPFRNVSTGISVSRRFQSDQQNSSENANFFLSLSRVPGLKGNLTARINYNKSNYLTSRIASLALSKNLLKSKLQARVYYRFVNYRYAESNRDINQFYLGTNLYYRLSKSLRFGISAEMNKRDQLSYYSFQSKLIKRFGS